VYKKILFFGYILNLIGIGLLLTSIGWLLLGNKNKHVISKITGITGFLTIFIIIYYLAFDKYLLNNIFNLNFIKYLYNYPLIILFLYLFIILQIISLWLIAADFNNSFFRPSSILFSVFLLYPLLENTSLITGILGNIICSIGFYLLPEKIKEEPRLVSPQF